MSSAINQLSAPHTFSCSLAPPGHPFLSPSFSFYSQLQGLFFLSFSLFWPTSVLISAALLFPVSLTLPPLPLLLISSHSSDLQRRGCWRSVRSWPSWQARWPRRWSAATHPAPAANQRAAFGSCWWSHSPRESPAVPPQSWRRSRGPGTCRSCRIHNKW